MIESQLREFKQSVEASMMNIQSLDDFKNDDKMVMMVYDISRDIFEHDLDTMSMSWLISNGGRLSSVRAYFGNRYAESRAKADMLEQKRDEEVNKRSTLYYGEENKITLARARAKEETSEIGELIVVAEFEKKRMEELLNSLDRLIGFIQSAIKVKQSERFTSGNAWDGAGY